VTIAVRVQFRRSASRGTPPQGETRTGIEECERLVEIKYFRNYEPVSTAGSRMHSEQRTEGDDDKYDEEIDEWALVELRNAMSGSLAKEVGGRTWLSWKYNDSTIAEPKPVVTLTLMPPIILQTMMYHIMLFDPYLKSSISDCNSRGRQRALWPEVEYNGQRRGDEDADVDEEGCRDEERLKLPDLRDGFLLWTCAATVSPRRMWRGAERKVAYHSKQ
jgi:hypothetical protein